MAEAEEEGDKEVGKEEKREKGNKVLRENRNRDEQKQAGKC